jgi:hypothetical protein
VSEETPHGSIQDAPTTAQRRHFRILLRGQVSQGWIAVFDPLSYSSSPRVTWFEVLADQAGLRGILNRLWDLNLDILSVVEIYEPANQNGGD